MILIYSTPSGKDDYFYRRYMQSKTIKVNITSEELIGLNPAQVQLYTFKKLKEVGVPVSSYYGIYKTSKGTLSRYYDLIASQTIYEWRP